MPSPCQGLLAEETLSSPALPDAGLGDICTVKKFKKGGGRRTHYYKLPAIRSRGKKVPFSLLWQEREGRAQETFWSGDFFLPPLRAPSSSCPFSSRNAESQRQERKWRGRNLVRDSTAVRKNNFEHVLYIDLHVLYSMLHFPTFGEFSQSAPLVALYSQKVFPPSSSLCCSLRTALRRRQEKVGGRQRDGRRDRGGEERGVGSRAIYLPLFIGFLLPLIPPPPSPSLKPHFLLLLRARFLKGL